VLYRLPELLASDADETVFVVEGEKDADNLRALGLLATCNPDGASATGAAKWYPRLFNPPLKGHPVVILPDRDTAGDNHAAYVAASLRGEASSVKVINLPGLEWTKSHGADVSDWLLGGGTKEELLALAETMPEWAAPSEPTGEAVFAETDSGQAELFAHLYGDRVRYDWLRTRWLVWDKHRWVPDADGELYRLAIDTARHRAKAAADMDGEASKRAFAYAKSSESAGKIKSMLDIAKALPPVNDTGLGWDANPLLVGCTNGVVNLTTGELRPGRREDRVTMTTGVAYDPDAQCPTWLRFIESVFDGEEMRAFIQRVAGYVLTGVTREQVWFLCHGSGSNGKSTFIDTLSRALGEYGGDTPADTLCSKGSFGGGAASPDVAALVNRRLVTCNETEELGRLNAGKVKHLTGGSPVTARPLYGHPFTYLPTAKIVLTTNHLPKVDDESEGFWRRVRLIPFTRHFSIEDRDDQLGEKLLRELPGVLAWAVRGAVEWHRVGLSAPADVFLATLAYREASDPLAEFIAECCDVGDNYRGTRKELYGLYKQWAEGQGYREKDVWGVRYFGERVGARWPSRPSNGQRYYMGIGPKGRPYVTQVTLEQVQSDVASDVTESSQGDTPLSSRVPETTSLTSLASLCPCSGSCMTDPECDDGWAPADDPLVWHCSRHHPEIPIENAS
jgi:putative DNA primase/helicase